MNYCVYEKISNDNYTSYASALVDVLYEELNGKLDPEHYHKLDEFIFDLEEQLPEFLKNALVMESYEVDVNSNKRAKYKFNEIQECYAIQISHFARSLLKYNVHIYHRVYELARNYIENNKHKIAKNSHNPNHMLDM